MFLGLGSGVLLKIKVGICCKQCGRGTEVAHRRRKEVGGMWGGGVPFPVGSQNGEFLCIMGRIFAV